MAGTSDTTLPPDVERRLAAALFNHVWELLETQHRSTAQDDRMVHAAHASRYHWGQVGEPVNLARGEWQCSRVYSVLGRAEPARHHGQRCLDIAIEHQLSYFDQACGYEALARASAVAGDRSAAARYAELGRQAAERIIDPEDRDGILGDLTTIP
jgi:hypothetical protein